jgi:hypothetical protein
MRLSMRFTRLTALGAVAVMLVGGAALAQSAAWRTYSNADFHFSVDVPGETKEQLTNTPSAGGQMPTLFVAVDLGDRGALLVLAADMNSLNTAATPDELLEGGVKGALTNTKATLDSETSFTLPGGVVGRDVVSHTDATKFRYHVMYANKRVIGALGAGPLATGVPAEYDRFAASLKPLP